MTTDDVPWLAALAGITAMPDEGPGRCALRLTAAGAYGTGLADVAMLADFALGGAVRTYTGAGRVLPTLTLTIETAPAPPPRGLHVRAWAERPADGLGRAHGTLAGDGGVTGHCLATFALPRAGARVTPLPWDTPGRGAPPGEPGAAGTGEPGRVTRAGAPGGAAGTGEPGRAACAEGPGPSVRPREPGREVAVLARELGVPADGTGSVSEALLRSCCDATPDGLRMGPRPELGNRAGSVQGAVLFWLAARAARVDAAPVAGSMRFVSPAAVPPRGTPRPRASAVHGPAPLTATARVTGEGRTVTAATEIHQDGRLVAAGLFTYRRTDQGGRR